ncbi:MAG: Major facilitator family transporter [Myxococcaceae bacterium]|nr:Major facilitator family transporter [Myxococcaceae bacterium]
MIPPVVRRLGWVSFLTDVASEMIYPLLPAFLLTLGGGARFLGLMEGVAESISAFVKWWTGARSDRFRRRKPFVLAGYALATSARPFLSIVNTPFQVVFVRTLDRFGKGIRSAPRDALLASSVPAAQRGVAFGYHRMMDNLGSVVGPLVAFTLARGLHWPLRWIFAATIIPGLCSVALVAGLREAPHEQAAPTARPAEHAPLSKAVWRYLAVVAIFTLGSSADSFLLLRMVDLGLSEVWLPLVWLSLSAAKAATNMPGGRLSDRVGRRRTLAAAWLVYAIAYAAFPLTRSIGLTWGLLVFYGAYYGLAEGGEKALLSELARPDEQGRAFGALHAVTGIFVLPANVMFGWLYSTKASWAFGVSAACALLAVISLAALVGPDGSRVTKPAPGTAS